MIQFTLYSRSYCHLCDDMLQQLLPYQTAHAFEVKVIDLDTEAAPDLLAKYDELVPVLLGQKDGAESQQICHYFLDAEKLKVFFNE
ncbi:glutaredoxin family protein [Undibacterium sp. Ren11W]|uniref:glutaredoxin family protein n=1 Tax=Undibacterium sp. Ren11W TaxID=3413045 RepID=UPI003BF071C3